MATKKIVIPSAFDNRASFIKSKVVKMYDTEKSFVGDIEDSEGNIPMSAFGETIPTESKGNGMTPTEAIIVDLQAFVKQNEFIRTDEKNGGIEYSIDQAVQDRYGFASFNDFLQYGVEIDPSTATLQTFSQVGDIPDGYRWLRPEIILAMYQLGLELDPIFGKLITADINVSQPRVTIPFMNESDAMPQIIGPRESVELGQMSWGAKEASVVKFGIGIEMDSEVVNSVSINLLSHFMKDAGRQFNTALSAYSLMIAMNGEQLDGTASAATIGVLDPSVGFTYHDYKLIMARMERMGRKNMIMIADEAQSVDVALLPEFLGGNYQTRIVNVSDQTRTQELITHGLIPSKKILMVDPSAAMMKLTYQGMSIESERFARTDMNAAYVRCSTGFTTLFRDARLLIDTTKSLVTNPFPVWIDPTTAEKRMFRKRGTV